MVASVFIGYTAYIAKFFFFLRILHISVINIGMPGRWLEM